MRIFGDNLDGKCRMVTISVAADAIKRSSEAYRHSPCDSCLGAAFIFPKVIRLRLCASKKPWFLEMPEGKILLVLSFGTWELLYFQCTLEMINKDFAEYPEHRTNFFLLLQSINGKCFAGLLNIPGPQFKVIIDSIVWAFKHHTRNVAEIGECPTPATGIPSCVIRFLFRFTDSISAAEEYCQSDNRGGAVFL